MNPFRKLFDNLEPKVQKNKYLHTTFDAFHTFFFVPKTVNRSGAHIRDGMDLKRLMIFVVLALTLPLLFGMWNIGHWHYLAHGMYTGTGDGFFPKFFFGFFQILPIIVVSYAVGLGVEFLFAASRGSAVEEGFLVTGMLIPLIVPPDIPLWMVAIATIFAVIIGKEAFGGTGMNLINIALTVRVFLFFAYPTYMSGDSVWITWDSNFLHHLFGLGADQTHAIVQGFTGATPLGLGANPKGIETAGGIVTGLGAITQHFSLKDLFIGIIPGSVGETSAIAILIGALFLVFTKIADWRIMISMVLGLIFMSVFLSLVGHSPFTQVPWYYHLFMGGFLFAMAFMATDPVTAAQTTNGKYIYGFMIGLIGMLVRVINPAYPEGWMMAILFMNVLAPLIDHFVIQSNIKRRLARG